MTIQPKDFDVGQEFPPVTMRLSRYREEVYMDMAHSTAGGRFQFAAPNLHTDHEFAKSQGLEEVIYDGMLSAARVEGIVRDLFGADFFRSGHLMTKFIRPVYITDEDDKVVFRVVVKEKTVDKDGTRLAVEVRGFDKDDQMVVVGEASAVIR